MGLSGLATGSRTHAIVRGHIVQVLQLSEVRHGTSLQGFGWPCGEVLEVAARNEREGACGCQSGKEKYSEKVCMSTKERWGVRKHVKLKKKREEVRLVFGPR